MAEKQLTDSGAVPSYFLELLANPIAFHSSLARLCKSVTAGLLLSQACHWSRTKAAKARDGWFYKSVREWEEETCLGRREQDTARKILRDRKFIETKKDTQQNGIGQILFYRVNFAAIHEAFRGECEANEQAPNVQIPDAPNVPIGLPPAVQQKAPNVPMGSPAHIDSENKPYKEKTLSTCIEYTGNTSGGESPPASLTISREKMMRNLTTEPGRAPDREVMEAIHRARAAGGLNASQAKAYLGTFMNWKLWPYWEQIDAQQQISFPDPPIKPQSRPLPADFDSAAGSEWRNILSGIRAIVKDHVFDTWLKPTKGRGVWRGVLYVEVPAEEFRGIREKFDTLITERLGTLRDVKFVTKEDLEDWRESA